jgi:hypothetical protein
MAASATESLGVDEGDGSEGDVPASYMTTCNGVEAVCRIAESFVDGG